MVVEMKEKAMRGTAAAISAVLMSASVMGCGNDIPSTSSIPELSREKFDELSGVYNMVCDADGNPIDLGGMEIIIRDWWSDGEYREPVSEYEEALDEYRAWIQEAYNFKISQVKMSDWESVPGDFIKFYQSGGDGRNYIWIMRECSNTVAAMMSGMAYDLSTIDCLDFDDAKFKKNMLHEQYSIGDSVYGMYVGYSEPRTGVYFNKSLLLDAGIDPEEIYDMQKNNTWTWEEFDRIMSVVQRDTDGDGINDYYGLTTNEGTMTKAAIYSNGGELVGRDEEGNFTYCLEKPETIEALKWIVEIYEKYDQHEPEGVEWDYYKDEFLNGTVAFVVEDEYAGMPENYLDEAEFDIGFVMFPRGPQAEKCVNVWCNNPVFIPNVYDADTAWKIAFAYNLYTNQPAGFEDYVDLANAGAGVFDSRAVDETITMMMQKEHGIVTYAGMMPNEDVFDYLWYIGPGADIDGLVEEVAPLFMAIIEDANGL